MAWEWVAPVATSGVGVAGIITTYLMGRLQVTTQRRVVDATSDRQLDREKAARQYESVADFIGWIEATKLTVFFYRGIYHKAEEAYRSRTSKEEDEKLTQGEVDSEIAPYLEEAGLPKYITPDSINFREFSNSLSRVEMLFDASIAVKARAVSLKVYDLFSKSNVGPSMDEFAELGRLVQEFRVDAVKILSERALTEKGRG